MNNNNQINGHQFFLILIHSQIGVGMITLANDVHLKAKSDSWISALIAGVFIQCLIFLFGALIHRFPGSNLFEMIEIVIGKVLGKILTFLYCWYFIVSGAILFAKYTIILKSWMLPLTPKWVLISALGILTVYLAIDNLVVISRFFILSSLVLFIFFLSLFPYCFFRFSHLSRIRYFFFERCKLYVYYAGRLILLSKYFTRFIVYFVIVSRL